MNEAPDGDGDGGGAVPLSRSALWRRQRDFYCREGIDAWRKVPFYATSNPCIADGYAHLILAWMGDMVARTPGLAGRPFPIVELGAGAGVFAWYLVRRLASLLTTLGRTDLDFVYVLTDVAERNVDFWCQHPEWEPYVAAGRVDFACYDVLDGEHITLEVSGRTLEPAPAPATQTPATGATDDPRPPLIAIANYVLDSIPTDLFRVQDGQLQEGRVPPSPAPAAEASANQAVSFEEIDSPVQYRPVTLPYYGEAARDAVLQRYRSGEDGDGWFFFPIAATDMVDRLAAIGDGNLLLVASDKGYAHHRVTYGMHEPDLAMHGGACSIMVNFDALGHYFRERGGDCAHQRTQLSLATSLFILGASLTTLEQTDLARRTWLDAYSPGDLFAINKHLWDTAAHCSSETLISWLNVTHWDPEVFNQQLDLVLALVAEGDACFLRDLAEGIPRVAEQAYQVPGAPDTMATLGRVLQEMERFEEAIACYERSRRTCGDTPAVLVGLGVCQLFLERYAPAVEMFEQAVAQDPDDLMARGWLSQAREWQIS